MADPENEVMAERMYPEIIAEVRAAFLRMPLVAVGLAVATARGPRLHWGGADEWLRDDSRLMDALREAQSVAIPFALAGVAESMPPLAGEFHRETRSGLTVAVNWVYPEMRFALPADAEAKAKTMSRDFLDAQIRWRQRLVPGPGILQ